MGAALKQNEAASRWQAPGRLPVERHGTARDWIEAGTHCRIEGDGPALILIHGVGLDLTQWEPQVKALARHFTVIRYDMLGHGLSAKPPGERSLKDFVGQLDNLHRYLQLDQAAIVGFSMGGLVARAFAQSHPDKCARLVIMNSVYKRSEDQQKSVRIRYQEALIEGPATLIDAALERWFSNEYARAHPDIMSAIRQRLEENDPKGFLAAYRIFAEADLEMPGVTADITCPTLVVTGAQDPGSSPDMAMALAAAIPGARSRIWPGLRHMAPIEGADLVNDTLLEFLLEGSTDHG